MSETLEEAVARDGGAAVMVFVPPGDPDDPRQVTRHRVSRAGVALEDVTLGPALSDLARAFTPAEADGVRAASYRYFPRAGLIVGYAKEEGLSHLQHTGRVLDVRLASQLEIFATERVAGFALPASGWPADMTGVSAYRDRLNGHGVLVGHLDTGISDTHPSLRDACNDFAEFDEVGSRIPGAKAYDLGGHGTETAGIICGRHVNGWSFGIAPAAQVVSARVADVGDKLNPYRVGGCVEWMLEKSPRIINVSLGEKGYIRAYEPLIAILRASGALVIAAIGNKGAGTSYSPGNYINVLSVGACDHGRNVWEGSCSQTFTRAEKPSVPDLVAPGAGVVCSVRGDAIDAKNGTSLAAPHVSGFAALLLQAKPNATARDLERAILSSCTLPAAMTDKRAGVGLPNLRRALEALQVA